MSNAREKKARLVIIEKSDAIEAINAANLEATATYKNVIMVALFNQGNRIVASGTLPIGRAITMLKSDPVTLKKDEKAGLDDVRNAYNRPIDKDHVKAVSDYLCNNVNGTYILPSLTVNATETIKVFTIESDDAPTRIGYLVIDFTSASLTVTDGQHRLNGMTEAIHQLKVENRDEDAKKLMRDGISIMFSFEENINQIHQDFADCSKTKALPKSMIAVYDQRIPVNRLTLDVIDKCPLFNEGKVDSASTSHSAKSTAVVLASNIRAILKGFYCGALSMADSAFDNMTNKELEKEEKYIMYSQKVINYLDLIVENNEVLKQISLLPKGPERQLIPKLRSEYYIASPAGLGLFAKLIHELESDGYSQTEINDLIVLAASEIDWKKSASLWDGNVITKGLDAKGATKYSINSTNRAVSTAIEKIRHTLGVERKQAELDFA